MGKHFSKWRKMGRRKSAIIIFGYWRTFYYATVINFLSFLCSDYDRCGSVSVGEESFFSIKQDSNSTRLIDLETNATDEEDSIYNIVHTISEKAIFPRESSQYYRTRIYLFCCVICDGCWLLSAFLLFGTYLNNY